MLHKQHFEKRGKKTWVNFLVELIAFANNLSTHVKNFRRMNVISKLLSLVILFFCDSTSINLLLIFPGGERMQRYKK